MRAAGSWLARQDRGFTPAEKEAFAVWLQADSQHAAAVAQLQRTMAVFDRLRELAPQDDAPPNWDVLALPRSSFGRRWRAAGFAAVGLAAAMAIGIWAVRPTAPEAWHYATAGSGYDRATLADGSIVELNANTSVDVEYTATERRVRLTRGEAHFQVAKDSRRPFVVQARKVAVSAVGTAFNVRLAPSGVEVLVTEGRVRVAPSAPESPTSSPTAPALAPVEIPLLMAGHKVMVPTEVRAEAAQIATVSREEIQHALAWQTRVAEFRKTSLATIVAEFNRQNQQQIVIGERELESLRIGGNFRADQPEAFVRLLEISFGINADRSGQVITLRKVSAESP